MKKTVFLLVVAIFLYNRAAYADNAEMLLREAEKINLSSDPTWKKLLHYEYRGTSSVVLDDAFFLSPEGRSAPQAELEATIRAYFHPWKENNDRHPRCMFPARYYWLSRHLDLPGYRLRETQCRRLENWALFDSISSVSVLLVSGYLGNPASTFGHGLLKFNTESEDDTRGMFDLAINYGALIPENEGVLRYVYRGLFGGYKAGFSDRYFYTKDLVYSRREYRDIWDYELALSNHERTLLVLHVWEIIGKKFTYYFLDKNCAFRLAELVDLVLEENLVRGDGLWYLPENMFHRFKEIHASRLSQNEKGLIRKVRYVPSAQRKLYRAIEGLSSFEIATVNRILKRGPADLPQELEGLSEQEKINVLDALLSYQHYRITSSGEEEAEKLEEEKKDILLARLALAPYERPQPVIAHLDSPADGSRPMGTNISYAFDRDGDPFVRLSWSPFKKEAVGANSLESDELVVLDVTLGILDSGERVELEELDIIRILNLNMMALPFEGEDQWSWNLLVGARRIGTNDDDRLDGILSFGVGTAKKLHPRLAGYAMIDFAAHSQDPYVRMRPHIGARFDWGACKLRVYGGAETDEYDVHFQDIWGGELQYQMTDRLALKTEVSNEKAARYTFGLSIFW